MQIQGDIVTLSLALAGIVAIAMHSLDAAYTGKSRGTKLLLRCALVAVSAAGVFLFCGSRVGSLAHAANQVGPGNGDWAGYDMRVGPPPFG